MFDLPEPFGPTTPVMPSPIVDLCLIGEGFEALDFQFFQAHSMGTFQNS